MSDGYDIVVRGGTVVTASQSFSADIGIRSERIAAVGENLPTGLKEIDARGRLVMPGGVDPHAHIEQMSGMGLMNADTFETATRSAAMGGTTTVISFAAQHPGMRLSEVVADYAALAERGAMIDHAFHMIVSDPDEIALSEDLPTLIGAGHRSIKIFTTYDKVRLDDRQVLDVMACARAHGAMVCIHAENDGLISWAKDQLTAAGMTRPVHHALSHPRLAEIEAVERMIRFAEFLDQPIMLFHISTAEAAAAVRSARSRGAPVWAETCPHYLFMTEDVLDRPGIEGAKWMCSPPQRTEADQEALWHALALGELQLVSSDHAPYRFDQSGKLAASRDPPFTNIANGLPGLEVRLPLMFDAMVSKGRLGPEKFVELTSTAAARLYGLESKGRLAPGADADITIWDPEMQVTFSDNDLHDNVGYNPWIGRTVTGWPTNVILRGQVIVDDGQCVAEPGSGRFLPRRSEAIIQPTGRPAREAVEAFS